MSATRSRTSSSSVQITAVPPSARMSSTADRRRTTLRVLKPTCAPSWMTDWPTVEPAGVCNNILLPRALDSDRDDALPDGQTICTATEIVDHTDAFDSGYGGELRGESVSAADGMQIAGMDRYSCHPD